MAGQHSECPNTSDGTAHSRLEIDAGCSEFAPLRRDGSYYVDKTGHLPDLLRGHGPLLLTRPRRFGKTLTLDTLRCFLELDYQNPGSTAVQQELFEGLAIMEDPALQECRERCMGRHPVVAVSLARVQGGNFTQALYKVRDAVAPLYEAAAFRPVLEAAGARLDEDARLILRRYYRLGSVRDPDELEELLPMALPRLCQALHHLYGRSVYVLIDEYDTPLAKAWSAERELPQRSQGQASGYYARMLSLMRGLLLPLLKPDPVMQGSIARCLCTGCTRISRESLFSGANNLIVQGMNHRPTATLMGFTEDEVQELLGYYGLDAHMDEVRAWYDGYRFAGVRIYNPWSIANYCRDVLDTPGTQAGSYWAHAGVNDELTACLQALPEEGLEQLRQLYEGDKVSLELLDFFSYDELLHRPDAASLFTLLYHTGFITRDDETEPDGSELPHWRIPNAEVRECFEQQILGMYQSLTAGEGRVAQASRLGRAMLAGRPQEAGQLLESLLCRYLSFHALAVRSGALERLEQALAAHCPEEILKDFMVIDDRRPERIYQVYAAGVLCTLCPDQITELGIEQELGAGHADLSFIAASDGHTGCVLEFKKAADISPDREGYQQRLQEQCRRAAREGLDQIAVRGYALGLMRRYALREVQAYGIGCAGKRCAVEWRRYGRDDLEAQA